MFDGLKDKLSSFTSDVEEDVDEEEVESDESTADDERIDGAADGDESTNETAEADEAAEKTADVDESHGADTGDPADIENEAVASDTSGSGPVSDGDSGTAVQTERTESEPSTASSSNGTTAESDTDETESEPDTDETEDDSDGRSLTEKAKLVATGKTVIESEDLQSHLDDLELALLSSDVEMSVAKEILSNVEENLSGETRRRLSSTGNLVRDSLREALYDVISVGQFDFDERIADADKPVVIIFTGVNGVGKTTTIAKLAQYFEERGLSSVLANGDTYRAGANEQLEQHADALGKKIITHEQGSDPTAVIYDAVEYAKANDVDVVLGDTAGRLHTSDDLMAQLEKIDRNIDPDMTLFVDEAVAGQDAVNRAREFNDAATIDGAVLTKADADSQGGAAISVAHVTGKPILFLGTGQDYDDLDPFDPEQIIDSLLG
jgi:fused signal recognition particle receptor